MYWLIAVLSILFFGISYFYYVVSDIVMKGQTIGKKKYNIRIIRENGEGITFVHAMIREFFRVVVDAIVPASIVIFFSKKNKRIGDMLASTIVVEEQSVKIQLLEDDSSYNEKYNLTNEERELIKDYFSRKDDIDIEPKEQLQNKLATYFVKKYTVNENDFDNKDRLLKSFL